MIAAAALALSIRYFDAHNHITGVLPYYAYANLPAYVAGFSDPSKSVTRADELALFRYLSRTWYPAEKPRLGDAIFSPPDGQRFSLGARATLELYDGLVETNALDLDGALERVLTATPWSEFDSAYAFRGGPAADYLRATYYNGDDRKLGADLCEATILDLAQTHVDESEQSLPFIGGFGLRDGRSDKLDWIECAMHAPQSPQIAAALGAMGRPAPVVKIVLMTHTSELATLPGGTTYGEWSKSGTCAPVPLPNGVKTSPSAIFNGLLGRDESGAPAIAPSEQAQYFATVVGIDTAGPETTCFSSTGMDYYKSLVESIYAAAKLRRQLGWHGKLLVHTHVGEGAAVEYASGAPPRPWTFAALFATMPPVRTNASQAEANVAALLAAIADLERAHPDLLDYVVFRLAHDTWASDADARAMHDERVEADVNLESNVATGAYPLGRAPVGESILMRNDVDPLLGNPGSNLALNDLLSVLIHNPTDDVQVGAVLGNASLKFLLERRVRALLGTDAAGVEHSDIVKEFEYASSLIGYWDHADPAFARATANASADALLDNVRWHEGNMSSDVAEPY